MPQLGQFALMAKEHMSHARPRMYAELLRSGKLDRVLAGMEEQADRVMEECQSQGLDYATAFELASPYLFLPSENEQPVLGGPVRQDDP